jgi:Fis family transcriptional regulator
MENTIEQTQASVNSAPTTENVTATLRQTVESAVKGYFQQMDGQSVTNLYDLVLAEVEEPLLKSVMEETRGNQSKAAITLGLSRGTLRKKLKSYDLL